MKYVEDCLSAIEDPESSFDHFDQVGASLFMCGKDLITPFSPPRRCCEACGGLLKCRRRSRKQFSPRWRTCEVGASLFMCGKDLITPFSHPRKCCEVRGGLFKCHRRSRKQF